MAEAMFQSAKRGGRLPRTRRRTLHDALALAEDVCRVEHPVMWFTGSSGDLRRAWSRLDEVYGIGPKIASFLMRDLSLLRDFVVGQRGRILQFGTHRQLRWFAQLPAEDQALFVPIDAWVHTYARQQRASPKASPTIARHAVPMIQLDPHLHRRAATEIVRWARVRRVDPRDVNVYWYSLGAGNIHRDGTPTE